MSTPSDADDFAAPVGSDEPTKSGTESEAGTADAPDLDVIASDLANVEAALSRLAEGTYWTDEVTGDEIPHDVLAADPTARRAMRV